MMDSAAALWIAIDLRHAPSRAKEVRAKPLPEGVVTLLLVAAGDEEAIEEACARVRRSPDAVREAAVFFIEQILLFPGADSYRVLGTVPGTSYADLRRNMALLLRWLHPDVDPQGERAIFTQKVTRAWSDLKTKEGRAAYGKSKRSFSTRKNVGAKVQAVSAKAKGGQLHGNLRLTPAGRPVRVKRVEPGLLRRMLFFLVGRVA